MRVGGSVLVGGGVLVGTEVSVGGGIGVGVPVTVGVGVGVQVIMGLGIAGRESWQPLSKSMITPKSLLTTPGRDPPHAQSPSNSILQV